MNNFYLAPVDVNYGRLADPLLLSKKLAHCIRLNPKPSGLILDDKYRTVIIEP